MIGMMTKAAGVTLLAGNIVYDRHNVRIALACIYVSLHGNSVQTHFKEKYLKQQNVFSQNRLLGNMGCMYVVHPCWKVYG